MRACLVTVLGLSLGLPPGVALARAPAPGSLLSMRSAAAATSPEEDATAPEVLYEEGRKAYRLGNFSEAVAKWEKAYDVSEKSLLLYNISLAYKGLYGISGDIEDLRRARAVMKNFLIIAQSDPETDPDDAEERITELDQMIADAESSQPPPKEDTKPDPDDQMRQIVPEGPDPGRPLRIGGAATMGAGGLLLLTGTVLGIYFGVRGQEFSDELRQAQADRPDLCMDPDSDTCQMQDDLIASARTNGRKANLGMGLSFGIAGGLGVLAIPAGAVLFVVGNRRTAEWKHSDFMESLRVVPTGRGLALAGRF